MASARKANDPEQRPHPFPAQTNGHKILPASDRVCYHPPEHYDFAKGNGGAYAIYIIDTATHHLPTMR